MKLRYLIASIAAILTLAVSCENEADHYLSEITVSQSYVGIPAQGGSKDITLDAASSWSVTNAPSWLTITPSTGSAGSSKISISAGAATDSREASIYIECNGQKQTINIIQQTVKTETPLSNCSDVIAGPDSKTYRIQGAVTKITETAKYGNFYMNDGTGEVYIYGTKYEGQTEQAALLKLGVEVGDVITVEGPKTTYNGTVELVDVDVIKLVKSLLKVIPDKVSVPSKGGDAEIKIVCKGDGLDIKPKSDWISLANVKVASDTTVVSLKVAENTGDPRNGEVEIFTSIPGQESSLTVTVSQAGMSGTLATPFTVAQAIQFCNELGGTSDEPFYIKGTVTKVLYTFSGDYGTGTFWISDDGTDSVTENKKSTDDKSHDFECYSVYWLGNQPWTDGQAQVSPGDEVIICGNVTLYNGLAETASKKAYVYSVNGVTIPSAGAGSKDYPFTVAGAINALNGGLMNADLDYFVKGKVTQTLYTFSADYGTGTFWISDDGTDSVTENKKGTNDKNHDFECYSVYWLGNKPWVEGNPQVAAGDEVVIAGKLTLYNGVSETSSKKAYVYSINGVTE